MAERLLARRHLRRRVLQRHQILWRQGRRALRMVTKTVDARQPAQWMSVQPAKIGIGCDDPRGVWRGGSISLQKQRMGTKTPGTKQPLFNKRAKISRLREE